jgi:hypothetical protein
MRHSLIILHVPYTLPACLLKFAPLVQVLEEYNMKKKNMNLVFFEDALEHLTRIHRIIRLDQGNALLVGVGGSGKQSLTKLAAFTSGQEVFEINLARGYVQPTNQPTNLPSYITTHKTCVTKLRSPVIYL